jgi:hypothetical protein
MDSRIAAEENKRNVSGATGGGKYAHQTDAREYQERGGENRRYQGDQPVYYSVLYTLHVSSHL